MPRTPPRLRRFYEPAPDYDDTITSEKQPNQRPVSLEREPRARLEPNDSQGRRSQRSTIDQEISSGGADEGGRGYRPQHLPHSTQQLSPSSQIRSSTSLSPRVSPAQSFSRSGYRSPQQTISGGAKHDNVRRSYDDDPNGQSSQQKSPSQTLSDSSASVGESRPGNLDSTDHRSSYPASPSTLEARKAAEELLHHRRQISSPHATPPQTLNAHEMGVRSFLEAAQQQMQAQNLSSPKSPQSPSSTINQQMKSPLSSPSQTLASRKSDYEYIDDRMQEPQQREPHRNINSYIREFGVPVLPPLAVKPHLSGGIIGAGDNLAFRRHVANHRKFDTLNSFQSCEKCPICQAMNEGAISFDEAAAITKHSHAPYNESTIISGRAFEAIQKDAIAELDALEEYVSQAAEEEIDNDEEDTETGATQTEETDDEVKLRAQVIQDFEGENEAELSVKQGDVLQVIKQKNTWWKCRNSQGESGWVPVCYIYQISD